MEAQNSATRSVDIDLNPVVAKIKQDIEPEGWELYPEQWEAALRLALPYIRDAVLAQAEKDAWADHDAAGGRNTQHGYTAWWLGAYRKRVAK